MARIASNSPEKLRRNAEDAELRQLQAAALQLILATGIAADLPDRFGRTGLQRLVKIHPTLLDDPHTHFQRRLLLARMLAAAGAIEAGPVPVEHIDAVVHRAAVYYNDDLTVALMPKCIKSHGFWQIVLDFVRPRRR